MFDIDLQSRVPIYEQLYNKIVELTVKGVLKENQQLPSVRVLAKQIGINPNTVAKTYQELERNGIIYSASGRGSFISSASSDILKKNILADFDAAAEKAINSGIPKDELIQRLNEVFL